MTPSATETAWRRFRAQSPARQALLSVVAAFVGLVLVSGVAGAVGGAEGGSDGREPSAVSSEAAGTRPSASPAPVVEIRTETTTEAVPHGSGTVDDATMASGTSAVVVSGADGVLTRTFQVTYTDGVETGRVEVSQVVTTPSVDEVVARGTKVEPAPPPPASSSCPNGTYTNSDGASVCRPHESASAPAGATAQCNDGTWSHSQSRRGTCSGHGGVKQWL